MFQTVSMAASRNHSGRPRRPEALKGIYLRESLRNNWRTRKNSLGYTELTESEFAKVLLHAAHKIRDTEIFVYGTHSLFCFEPPFTVQHQYKQSSCILKRKENVSTFIQKIAQDRTVMRYNLRENIFTPLSLAWHFQCRVFVFPKRSLANVHELQLHYATKLTDILKMF